MTADKKVCILGAEWTIKEGTEGEFPGLAGVDGYADSSIRTIVIDSMIDDGSDPLLKHDMDTYKKSVLRHEIIHAFLYESGLDISTNAVKNWADNEEMVDWFAIHFPKILHVCRLLEAI